MISTLWETTPPHLYGGTERIVSYVTEELVRRGHDVTLFATGDSKTKAKLISTYPRALYRDGIPWTSYYDSLSLYSRAMEYSINNNVDIIHSNAPYYSLPFVPIIQIPMIHTIHGNIGSDIVAGDKIRMLEEFKNANFISISNSQRRIKKLNFVATVYNGIPIQAYDFKKEKGKYLVWLGRFTPVKGAKEAIKIALKLEMPLILAGKIDWAVERDKSYFKQFVEPNLKGKIEYIGEVAHKEKNKFLGNAYCLLNPLSWDEPFGLVPVEANACGTPVVAFARGAMPELVENGKNGFLVKPGDIDGMVGAVKKIGQIDRSTCRRHVEENFTIEKMVDGYERVYEKITQNAKPI